MCRFKVKKIQAVWETMTFEVDLPDEVPEGYESHEEYIEDNYDEVLNSMPADDVHIEQGDEVSGIDSDVVVEEIEVIASYIVHYGHKGTDDWMESLSRWARREDAQEFATAKRDEGYACVMVSTSPEPPNA